MRLAKYLAHAGVASRRASEVIIQGGRVEVDGAVVTDPARDVDDANTITVDGKTLSGAGASEREVWAVHKPRGVVSTASDTHGRKTVVELVKAPGRRLYPVGRLDAETTGLILLTDDGELANQLTHPRYEVPKVYLARVERGPVHPQAVRRLREGVQLEDGMPAPAGARLLEPSLIELTLREGRKRQVRRMCTEVGYPVRDLMRIGFGPLTLGEMKAGAVRKLTDAEVGQLRGAAGPGDKR
jgi:23S rRNA pseudouridine2605 synthase